MIEMKWIMSSALAGVLLVTAGSLAFAEEKDEKDLSAYQWGYWDKMVSPAAGPLAPVGDVASAPLPPAPIPTPTPEPTPIPEPEPIKLIPGWSTNESPVTPVVTEPDIKVEGGAGDNGSSPPPPPPPPPPASLRQ